MRILVFGGSTTQGAFDSECGGWADRLKAHYFSRSLETDSKMLLYNLGISGEVSGDLKDRIMQEITPRLIGDTGEVVILIQCGMNDSKYSLEEGDNRTYLGDFKSNYKSIVAHALEYSDHVFCLGLTQVDESKTNPFPSNAGVIFRNKDIADYQTVIKGVAFEAETPYVELSDLITSDSLSPDGIHSNAEGHERIFQRVKDVLEAEGLL